MGNLCVSMAADDVDAAKKSKEVDAANEAAFKKVSMWFNLVLEEGKKMGQVMNGRLGHDCITITRLAGGL